MKKTIMQQIIAPIQQWLLEQGICLVCGRELSAKVKKNSAGAQVVSCECGETYLYLSQAHLYKRLTANKYV